MRVAFATIALVAFAAAVPQGVTTAIAPTSSPPASCSKNYDGSFQIATTNVSSNNRRSLETRQHSALGITLRNGILTDQEGRTGYIASNSQFQFDDPPQAGAIYTAGFSVCTGGRLAIGNDDTWQRCLSGPGTTSDGFFYNLYLENDAGQCIESYILTIPVGNSDGPVAGSGSTSADSTLFTTSANAALSSVRTSDSATANISVSTALASSSLVLPANSTRTGSALLATPASQTISGPPLSSTTTTARTTCARQPPDSGMGKVGGQQTRTTLVDAGEPSSTSSGTAMPTSVLGRRMAGLAAGILAAICI